VLLVDAYQGHFCVRFLRCHWYFTRGISMNTTWSFYLRAQPGGAPGWQWVRRDRARGSMLASFKYFAHLMECFEDASRHGFGGWAKASWLTGREWPRHGAANAACASAARTQPLRSS
jgi:hypothetical protein